MQELKQSIAQEQPPISKELEKLLQELPPTVRPVAHHVLMAGGKRLRPLLSLLTGRCLGCSHQDLYTLGAAIEMLHAATLLHDDIMDNATTRRNQPAAHTLYGITPTILAGDALLAKSLHIVSAMKDTALVACIAEATMRTAEGQMKELAHLRDCTLPHQGYLDIITGKTAWLLRASCELGALRAGATPEQLTAAITFGLELGIAFQVVDDALDFSPTAVTGKPFGGDIKEGKITPPLLFYIEGLPQEKAAAFATAYRNNALSNAELDAVCEAIVASGYPQKTRETANEHLEKAHTALMALPPTSERAILEQMIHYIKFREK